MDCLECKNLEEAFEFLLSSYGEARSAAYYRVSTELAAKKNVDMERPRYDLEEHRLICVSAAAVKPLDQWLPEAVAIMTDKSPSIRHQNRAIFELFPGASSAEKLDTERVLGC